MKLLKIIFVLFILLNLHNIALPSEVYFIDMKKILNESKAGKKAQDFLKKKFESENKKFAKEAETLKKEESDLIAKKKLVSNEEYKKSLISLRDKSKNYQNKKRQASNDWVRKKNEARARLLKALNPILQKYMKENNITIIIDKKNVLLAEKNYDLTEKVLKILDNEVQSIELK